MIRLITTPLLLLFVSCLFGQSGNFIYIQLKDIGIDSLQKLVMQKQKGIEYTVLYYSADYCMPCKKITKSLEEGEKAAYKSVRLIEINEKHFQDGASNPIWERYNVRSCPTLILVDQNLNELNRNVSRGWKKEQIVLDKFIKALWPDKTPEELKEEKRQDDQSRNSDQLLRAIALDTSLSLISRGVWQNRFLETMKGKFKEPKIEITSFEDFKKLTPAQIKSAQHLQLWWSNIIDKDEQNFIQFSLPQFENLEYLELFGEQFVPDEIYKLKNLKFLFLNGSYNKIPLTEEFVSLQKLEILELGYSAILLPKNINMMKNLRSIYMPLEALGTLIK